MERRIPEGRVDPHLAEKLTTEAEFEGLAVKAVAGLRRLMKRGRFELPDSVREARSQYRGRLDSVQAFVEEECELDSGAWTPRSTLYSAYRFWATEGGRLPVSVVRFNDHLRQGFPDRVEERTRRGSRGWAGVRLGGDGGHGGPR